MRENLSKIPLAVFEYVFSCKTNYVQIHYLTPTPTAQVLEFSTSFDTVPNDNKCLCLAREREKNYRSCFNAFKFLQVK